MAKFIVEGPARLHGEVDAIGNKNSVLKLIPASILFKGDYTLTNVPNISDVQVMLDVLSEIGARVDYDLEKAQVTINTDGINSADLPAELIKKVRASVMFIGPLLARFGYVKSVFPGGDKIGARELKAHFNSFLQLGVEFSGNEWGEFELKGKPLGGEVRLYEPSVTATENIILASALADAEVRIINAACEPHVQELCLWLQECGVEIKGIGSNLLTIKGKSELYTEGRTHEIWTDYLDVGALAVAAAVTGGELVINKVREDDMHTIMFFFSQLNFKATINEGKMHIPADQDLKVVDPIWGRTKGVYSQPWYAFPSDLMSIAMVLAMNASGSTLFFEKLYQDRMSFSSTYNLFGGNIVNCDPHRILINGKTKLRGGIYTCPDIRAGMSYFLAALASEGTTVIHDIEHIDRGYPNTDVRYQNLGANVRREM